MLTTKQMVLISWCLIALLFVSVGDVLMGVTIGVLTLIISLIEFYEDIKETKTHRFRTKQSGNHI
jgi:uncharacterized membrane protein